MKHQNRVVGVIAGLVVLLAVIAAVLSETRRPDLPDPGTPAAVVLDYLDAIVTGDAERAAALLDPELDCTAEQVAGSRTAGGLRATVLSTDTDGSKSVVQVQIDETGELLDSWSHNERFQLRRTGSSWLLTGNPWPVYECWAWEKGEQP